MSLTLDPTLVRLHARLILAAWESLRASLGTLSHASDPFKANEAERAVQEGLLRLQKVTREAGDALSIPLDGSTLHHIIEHEED